MILLLAQDSEFYSVSSVARLVLVGLGMRMGSVSMHGVFILGSSRVSHAGRKELRWFVSIRTAHMFRSGSCKARSKQASRQN